MRTTAGRFEHCLLITTTPFKAIWILSVFFTLIFYLGNAPYCDPHKLVECLYPAQSKFFNAYFLPRCWIKKLSYYFYFNNFPVESLNIIHQVCGGTISKEIHLSKPNNWLNVWQFCALGQSTSSEIAWLIHLFLTICPRWCPQGSWWRQMWIINMWQIVGPLSLFILSCLWGALFLIQIASRTLCKLHSD